MDTTFIHILILSSGLLSSWKRVIISLRIYYSWSLSSGVKYFNWFQFVGISKQTSQKRKKRNNRFCHEVFAPRSFRFRFESIKDREMYIPKAKWKSIFYNVHLFLGKQNQIEKARDQVLFHIGFSKAWERQKRVHKKKIYLMKKIY